MKRLAEFAGLWRLRQADTHNATRGGLGWLQVGCRGDFCCKCVFVRAAASQRCTGVCFIWLGTVSGANGE